MAIIPTLPGIKISVVTPDILGYVEYDDDQKDARNADTHPETKVIRKYIASETGAQFRLRYQKDVEYDPGCPTLIFELLVDGISMDNGCLMNIHNDEEGDVIHMGVSLGPHTVRPFMFAKINTSCADKAKESIAAEAKKLSAVGELEVAVFRGTLSKPVPFSAPDTWGEVERGESIASTPRDVHEKALKGQAKSHSVLLGEVQTFADEVIFWDSAKLDDHPIAKYTFKYRSEEALKQLMIIERTPEPEVKAQGAPPPLPKMEDLNEDEKRKVALYLQTLRGANGSSIPIKRERTDDVSFATSSGRSSKRSRKSGEKILIDLTDD